MSSGGYISCRRKERHYLEKNATKTYGWEIIELFMSERFMKRGRYHYRHHHQHQVLKIAKILKHVLEPTLQIQRLQWSSSVFHLHLHHHHQGRGCKDRMATKKRLHWLRDNWQSMLISKEEKYPGHWSLTSQEDNRPIVSKNTFHIWLYLEEGTNFIIIIITIVIISDVIITTTATLDNHQTVGQRKEWTLWSETDNVS